MAKKTRSNEQRQDVTEDEFIPFACHYDPHTLLTKNGELLQTIKITGFSFESVTNKEGKKKTLRRTIRDAVAASIGSNNFALWIHTIRRRKNLDAAGGFRDGSFEKHIHESWVKHQGWQNKFVNELYITVIVEGQSFKLKPTEYVRSLLGGAEINARRKYLEVCHQQLNAVVEKMLLQLSAFGAKRLGVREYDGISYSEPMQFLGKIVNLVEAPMPMPINDISEVLSTQDVAFGHNLLEVYGSAGRRYAAMLSIKEYHEVSSTAIDRFLQLDQEFIITEAFDFINNETALKKFEHQKYILSLSEDKKLSEYSGIDDILASNRGRPVDFGEHQITIMLFEQSVSRLEDEIRRMFKAFGDIGIVAVREDVTIEDSYWAQLPGNFMFLRRQTPINTARIGGFASLYNFPAGKIEGNFWGPAVSTMYTRAGTPYFFNFHDGNNGHTSIVGPFGAGKTVLLNFLTAESRKFNNRLFFFDQHRASELFLKAIGGNYRRILKTPQASELRMNPLRIPDTVQNHSFLRALLLYMAMDENFQLPDHDKALIGQAVEHIYLLPEQDRRLSNVIPRFWPLQTNKNPNAAGGSLEAELAALSLDRPVGDPFAFNVPPSTRAATQPRASTTAERLAEWYGNGKYAHLFDNPSDALVINEMVFGFGMTEMVQEKVPLIPVLSYLLHRIRLSLDGTPTMLVLDEAWTLIDNPVFAPHIVAWLEDLRKHNAMVVFATESVEDAKNSNITKTMMDQMATHIFLPNAKATEAYKEVFGLSEVEFEALESLSLPRREFLLRHHKEYVVATLDLGGMDDIIAVLSGSKEDVSMMATIMLDAGQDPNMWLPIFRERVLQAKKISQNTSAA